MCRRLGLPMRNPMLNIQTFDNRAGGNVHLQGAGASARGGGDRPTYPRG